MECPKCQFKNLDGIKFCGECGYELSQTQGPISDVYSHPQSYTPKHLADKILTTRSAIEGERKMVTVLFADVANYTSMSEKLDPEGVHQIMDGCFQILMDQIHNHEGTINQFTGDGVMALFGAPIAHEDHAQKACYAALSIQDSLQEYKKLLNDKFGVDFNMRIGINSGPVVVGSIGDDLRMDYTAIGDTTNLAARMENLAQPGSILVSKNTYEKVNPFFDFEDLGKYDVKGKKKQQEAYRIKRQKDRSHLGFTRKIYSEMVGRDAELNKLELQVLKAVDGEGSVVNVIGEAGIGKSRLIAELKLTNVVKKVALREGRAISMGKGLSFYPVIDIYKNWAKIKEGDSDATAINKLETSIRSVTPQDLHDILPFIATLMGIKLTGRYAERVKGIEGEALEKLILKSVKDLLIKSSELIPIAIVIEDLHWADLSTIELLESVFRLAETHRILFINVFRPRYTETGARIVQTVKEKFPNHYVQIELQPLNEQMSETLINNMLDISGLPFGVRDRIVARSGGNPFFIEEVVRSFIDDGVILRKNGRFEVTEKIESVVIPQTINDVLTARLDRLEEKTKDLVKTASVIGRSFFYKILSEVVKTLDDIDKRLEDLKQIQLIRDRIRMEELEYLFKHALTQEAAYESLLIQKRKELHHTVAESIERVFGDKLHEFYGMLAYHYSKGENPDKAEEYMIKAGEEAMRSSSSSEALSYYQEALKLYLNKHGDKADPEKLSMFEKNIGIALLLKGRNTEAVEYIDRVLMRWGVKFPKLKILSLIKLLFNIFILIFKVYFLPNKGNRVPTEQENILLYISHKKAQALVLIDVWRDLTEQIDTVKRSFKFDLTKVENGVVYPLTASGIFAYMGFFKISKKFLNYSESIVNLNDIKEVLEFDVYDTLWKIWSGNFDQLNDYDPDIWNRNLKLGELWHVSLNILHYAVIKVEQGKRGETAKLLSLLSDIADEYEYDTARFYFYVSKAGFLNSVGDFNEAILEADSGIFVLKQSGNEQFQIHLLGEKAYAQTMLEDFEGAQVSLEKAHELTIGQEFLPPYVTGCFYLAQFRYYTRALERKIEVNNLSLPELRKKANKSRKQALKTTKKLGYALTKALRFSGSYFWIVNDQDRAVKWWRRAIEEGERLGARPDLARTYLEIGKRLSEKTSKHKEINGIAAEQYLEKARAMFEEMNLQWDLDVLDRIVSYS